MSGASHSKAASTNKLCHDLTFLGVLLRNRAGKPPISLGKNLVYCWKRLKLTLTPESSRKPSSKTFPVPAQGEQADRGAAPPSCKPSTTMAPGRATFEPPCSVQQRQDWHSGQGLPSEHPIWDDNLDENFARRIFEMNDVVVMKRKDERRAYIAMDEVIDMLVFKGQEELHNILTHSKQRHHILSKYVVGEEGMVQPLKLGIVDHGESDFLKKFYASNRT
ncbi:hypothetical protein L7F22_005478 [Adiantum nelumboides]|nr:hypothetical protein [Adiantum nelumboides]